MTAETRIRLQDAEPSRNKSQSLNRISFRKMLQNGDVDLPRLLPWSYRQDQR